MKKFFVVLVMTAFIISFSFLSISAEKRATQDPAYNFAAVKTILIIEPIFKDSPIPQGSKDFFNPYPDRQKNIETLLKSRINNIPKYRFVTLLEVHNQMCESTDNRNLIHMIDEPDHKAMETEVLSHPELSNYVDLIFVAKINNYGWYNEYYPAHTEMRKISDGVSKESSSSSSTTTKTSTGSHTKTSGSSVGIKIPVVVPVKIPEGHYRYDNASVVFSLIDPVLQKEVWQYSDNRRRQSERSDNDGPESMMKRIVNGAFDSMPEPLRKK